MKRVVLDSFALVSLFHGEAGSEKVQQILHEQERGSSKALLNIVNWGEFYYVVRRRVGAQKAQQALELLEQLPVEIVPAERSLVRSAAETKAEYPVAYADAFAIATALSNRAVIVTSDPEFRAVEELVKVEWL